MRLSRVPLLPILASMVVGIVLYRLFNPEWWVIALLAVPAAMLVYCRRLYACILLCSVALGLTVALLKSPVNSEFLFKEVKEYSGYIENIKETESGCRIIVGVDKAILEGGTRKRLRNSNVIIYLSEYQTTLRPYDNIVFKGHVTPVSYNPDLPDDPDFTSYYYSRNIVGSAFIPVSDITPTGHRTTVMAVLTQIREKCSHILRYSDVSPECSDFLVAVLLGDSDSLTATRRNVYSDAGLAHVLALSGTHVAIICAFVMILLLPFRRYGFRIATHLIIVLFLWFYALMTGFSPSVARAVTMISIIYLAHITSRRGNSLNALCFSAILILFIQPRSLFSASFQLSFLAVAAILLFGGILKRYPIRNHAVNYGMGLLAATISATLGTSLLAAYYFHKFPVYSILANIPTVVLLPVILFSGLIILIAGWVGLPCGIFCGIADVSCEWLQQCADFFASLPYATISHIYFNAWIFLPFIAFLVLLFLYNEKRSSLLLLSSVLCLIMTVLFLIPAKKVYTDNVYIFGNSRGTDIVCETHNGIYVFSSRHGETPDMTVARLNNLHQEFLSKRSVDSFTYMDESCVGTVEKSNRMIWAGDMSMAILDKPAHLETPLPEGRADYGLLLANTSNHNIQKAYTLLNVDTIILPAELNHHTYKRYVTYLEENGLPYISLKNQKFRRKIGA